MTNQPTTTSPALERIWCANCNNQIHQVNGKWFHVSTGILFCNVPAVAVPARIPAPSVADLTAWTSIDAWLRENPKATAAECLAELVKRIKVEATSVAPVVDQATIKRNDSNMEAWREIFERVTSTTPYSDEQPLRRIIKDADTVIKLLYKEVLSLRAPASTVAPVEQLDVDQFEAWIKNYWPDWRKAEPYPVELMRAAWDAAMRLTKFNELALTGAVDYTVELEGKLAAAEGQPDHLTDLQRAIIEHDDDMARLDRSTLAIPATVRCPECGARLTSDFDEDVGMWEECTECDYRNALSSRAPASPAALRDDDYDDWVAWLRYDYTNEETTGTTIQVCDSDARGAFKVYRAPLSPAPATLAKAADWFPIETAPKDDPIWLFGPSLIDEDYNEKGVVEGYWLDDLGWMGAVWNNEQDYWESKQINPTHWMPIPQPPTKIKE